MTTATLVPLEEYLHTNYVAGYEVHIPLAAVFAERDELAHEAR